MTGSQGPRRRRAATITTTLALAWLAGAVRPRPRRARGSRRHRPSGRPTRSTAPTPRSRSTAASTRRPGRGSRPSSWPTRPGPSENVSRRSRPSFWMTYDAEQLYVAFRALDPEPAAIRARLTDRDRAFQDDFVGVVLDTFNDERRAFEFFVNPLGVQMDLIQNDVTGNEDDTWDAIWTSAGRITDEGYVVEMAIPFSSLRFPRADGEQTWGIDALRIYPRDQRAPHRPGRRSDRGVQLLPLPGGEADRLRGRHAGPQHRARPDAHRRPHRRAPDSPSGAHRGGRRRGRARADRALGHHAQPDLQRRGQPRLLAGRGRRRAARRQHPVRPLLPREAAVLPRGRGLLRHPHPGGLHPQHRRSRLGAEAHRQGGQERRRRWSSRRTG